MDAAIARILNAFDNASASDMAEGERWYETARITAQALAAGTSLSLAHAAGVIAALSPRVRWETNVAAAATMIAAAGIGAYKMPSVAGYNSNCEKAWKIANGDDPWIVLGGPKVRSFFANILGDEQAVTIDVWAARAAEGVSNKNAPSGRRYTDLADAYRMAARARDVSPMVMQATVWVYIRRTFGTGDQLMIEWEDSRVA
jgi:hypothetical protein